MDTSAVIAVVSAFVGVVAWAVRLESRVNEHERRHEEMREDVSYIRERIDMLVNGRRP